MELIHIAKGYLVHRHEGKSYLIGRACDHTGYVHEAGDIFLPWIGGIMVPEDMQQAIISRELKGRLVPYYMLTEPYLVDEQMLIDFDEATHYLSVKP